MATLISTNISNARLTLNETTAQFWTDAELLTYAIKGIKDLWKAIIDLNEGHFQTRDETNVSLAASTKTLTGVPADVFRVDLIEPRDLTSTSQTRDVTFLPRPTNHADFTGARSLGATDPNGREIYFSLIGAGSPIAAPTIEVAPMINAALLLRLIYTPTLATLTGASNNPIPGESDTAVEAWIIAYALARQRADVSPDPEWMAVYATEKTHILTALTPRQTLEPETAEAMFESYW